MYTQQIEIRLRNKTVGRLTIQVEAINMPLDAGVLRLHARQFLKTQRLSKKRMSEELLAKRLQRSLQQKTFLDTNRVADIRAAVFYGEPPETILPP